MEISIKYVCPECSENQEVTISAEDHEVGRKDFACVCGFKNSILMKMDGEEVDAHHDEAAHDGQAYAQTGFVRDCKRCNWLQLVK